MSDHEPVGPALAADLLATVQEASGHPDLAYAAPPTTLRGGYDAELVRFALADPPPALAGDLVARIVSNPANGAWEAAIQRDVARQGFPTPRVRLVADEASALGRALLVMDHVDGAPALGGLDPRRFATQVPALLRDLPDQLAGLAASLHALDPGPLDAELAALDGGIPTTMRGFVEQQVERAALSDRPDLAAAGERLVAAEPRSGRRVITHGDLHPFNVLVAPDGPQLIDWTVARVAHPGFTLAFTDLMLSHPPVEVPRAAALALRPIARRMARRFARSYRERAAPADQVTADQLAWHRQVHALRIVVELAGWEAAGTLPDRHPWRILEPVACRQLGLVAPAR